MKKIRLGAVSYLNARPLVFGLERSSRFDLRFDVPSRCAELLHEGGIDVGLIPSIEYLRGRDRVAGIVRNGDDTRVGTGGIDRYRIVPDIAITSRGPVASVLLYSARPIADVRSIAVDTSSRTSVALLQVLCARRFRISPTFEADSPHLESMLSRCDAALIIGDRALFPDEAGNRDLAGSAFNRTSVESSGRAPGSTSAVQQALIEAGSGTVVEKVDLGEEWTGMTGLPFVYAFWAGREAALAPEDIHDLQKARDAGVRHPEEIARDHARNVPGRMKIGARYLRDNIQYRLGADERAGLDLFYRYAAEEGIVPPAGTLAFYQE